MDIVLGVLVTLALLVLLMRGWLSTARRTPSSPQAVPIPASYRALLQQHVPFYRKLDQTQQTNFENRLMHFLATTRITGVNTNVEEMDKIFVAASAVIPIFGFPDWEYRNLNEVLLYPDSFNHDFEQQGSDRSILGMVGDGAMNRVMILSQHELQQAFLNKTGKTNTAIHEFTHLVDKSDGAVDGRPEFVAEQEYIRPWLQLMQAEIKRILEGESDINPYGATNEGEFFAVVSEYFFERPDLLQDKHPELYRLLTKIFRQDPDKAATSI